MNVLVISVGEKIQGIVNIISINEDNANSLYYLDEFCYRAAKRVGKNNGPGELN
jgi:hypothetical protein